MRLYNVKPVARYNCNERVDEMILRPAKMMTKLYSYALLFMESTYDNLKLNRANFRTSSGIEQCYTNKLGRSLATNRVVPDRFGVESAAMHDMFPFVLPLITQSSDSLKHMQ